MRQEVRDWWETATSDFIAAKNSFLSKDFHVAAFLCQQAVEKALKAVYILEKKSVQPVSHSLLYLGRETSLPKSFHSFLRELTPVYINSRYPDAEIMMPQELYTKEKTEEILRKTKEVFCG